jgi:hypothetical protein
MKMKSLAALALVGVLTAAAHAEQPAPDPGKLQTGGRPVRKGPPPPRASVATARREAYPLDLQFLGGGAGVAHFGATPDQPLTLELTLTNRGAARQFSLAALTWGMEVHLPAHVSLAPGESTRLEVTVTKRACQPTASFLRVVAHADGDGSLPVSTRASVRCR